MVTETRPSEPGSSGRVGGSLLEEMDAAVQPATGRLGTVRQTDAKVLSAQFIGTDANGHKVYKVAIRSGGRTNYLTRAWTGERFLKPRAMKAPRSEPLGAGGLSPDHLGARADQARLDAAKDQWLTTISNLTASPFHKRNLIRAVENHGGDAASLNQKMAKIVKAMQPIDAVAEQAAGQEAPFDPFAGLDFGGGGFGGGGAVGPTYVSPDRRVVEDFVKGALVSLVGTVPSDGMVDQFADVYMADHRKNFDSPGQEIDPSQSVKEAIRSTEQYQAIHALRPESEDERAWVAQRRQAAAQGGLNVGDQEDFAITQATAGGDVQDVQRAASTAQFQQSGSARGTLLEDKLRGVAQGVFSGVVR